MSSVSYRQASAAPVIPPGSVNVKLYGAVGDGVIDDTTSVERALAKVQEEGGTLFFPPGVYKITRTLVISSDSVRIQGSTKRASLIQFYPETDPDTLFLVEDDNNTQITQIVIEDLEVRAAHDTTKKKIAFELHGVRYLAMRNVNVQGWEDDDRESIGVYLKGWDNLLFQFLSLNTNIPLVIGQNDDGAGGFLDPTKDLDHAHFLRCNFIADNESKIGVLIEDAVVLRNVTFDGIAMVHGGFYWVDTTEPRRRSTNVALKNIRFEGFAETSGSVVGRYAVDIQKHANGKLRDFYMSNVLLAEGQDDRYGQFGANWNGLRLNGVINKTLVSVTYTGQAVPLVYTGAAPSITGGQFTHSDNGKAKPACEEQWDILYIPRPRSWWKFSTGSSNQPDQQDANVSGLADRTLNVNGTPVYQQFVEGFSDYRIKYTETADERFGLNSGLTDFNPNDRSAAWLAYWDFPAGWTPGGVRILMNLGSCAQAGAAGPNVYINASGLLEIYAGNTVVTGSRDYRGKSVAILAVYNRTAGTWTVYVGMDGSDVIETITGTYAAAVGSSNQKGFGAESGSFTSPNAYQSYGADWFNTDAESLSAATLQALGWGV